MSPDPYRDWDAAYVLGSLSPAERLEYEDHLASCPECTDALAELAGMPSLLASITAEDARALDGRGDSAERVPDAAPTLLPALLSRARASRRRSRVIAFAVGAGSIAAAVAVTLIVALVIAPAGAPQAPEAAPLASSAPATPGDGGGTGDSAGGVTASQVQFVAQVPGPLSAVASLQAEPWGTRIEWKCTWADAGGADTGASSPSAGYSEARPPASTGASDGSAASGAARGYGMIVTDRAGDRVQVATWTSGPGTVATPTATTSIHLADIAQVAIVAADSGQVLLSSTL